METDFEDFPAHPLIDKCFDCIGEGEPIFGYLFVHSENDDDPIIVPLCYEHWHKRNRTGEPESGRG